MLPLMHRSNVTAPPNPRTQHVLPITVFRLLVLVQLRNIKNSRVEIDRMAETRERCRARGIIFACVSTSI